MRFLPSLIAVSLLASAACGNAAQLDTTPDTLTARANALRDARERLWDPDAGHLGNLRHAQIVAPDCTVRVISGPENRLIPGNAAVRVHARSTVLSPGRPGKPAPRDVTITATRPAGASSGGLCFTLQVATAHDFLVGGDRLAVLFDRTALPVVRLYLNPSAGLKLWFNDVRIGWLAVTSNANATAGGTGSVTRLGLDSSQRSTALLFHDLQAQHIGVTTTTGNVRFSIRIGPRTDASYAQPARAPGEIAMEYPIWIDGPVSALKVPIGRVNAMPLTAAVRQEAQAVRDEVMRRAGPLPAPPPGPVADPLQASGTDQEPVSAEQRVADVLQRFAPPGVQIGKVNLWKGGCALEGQAPDEGLVRQLVRDLNSSGEVRNAQVGFVRPEQAQVRWRVLVNFMCSAPGEPSRCLPAPGGAYTQQQVEDALRPILKLDPLHARISLQGDAVAIEGSATEADGQAALLRVREQVSWLEGGHSGYNGSHFSARLRMVCTVPPRSDGICASGSRPR